MRRFVPNHFLPGAEGPDNAKFVLMAGQTRISLRGTRCGLVAALAVLECVALARGVAAQERVSTARSAQVSSGSRENREFTRPHGVVEFGIGMLALPDAKLCGEAGCDRGDVSLEVDAWPLFRASPSFAIGAGLTLALTPTQDVPQRNTRFQRDHSRRYFLVEGIGRYYLFHGQELEAWAGVSTGLVVVSDNFRTVTGGPDQIIIGSNSANIATEGLSLGLAAGVTFGVSEQLQIGGTLRVANWFLPARQEVITFGEEASLANRVTMLNLALTVAYHGR
jgi:hypothetical protein